MNIQLLVIDPQKDFCDPSGSLFVQGADQDMSRLAAMVNRLRTKIDGIHVTLDSHLEVDVAHPIFWTNSKGEHPTPFTIISKDDVVNGTWTTTIPAVRQRAVDYVTQLEDNARYPLCVWPPHCIIGSNGYAITDSLADALKEWSLARLRNVNYVTKGSNPFTEHYSAVQADVPDPSDASTMLNSPLLEMLAKADVILISGEALSHCVANTIRDVANNFGDENIKKFVLLKDTSSNVTGFDNLGDDFINEMTGRGMKVATSVDYLI